MWASALLLLGTQRLQYVCLEHPYPTLTPSMWLHNVPYCSRAGLGSLQSYIWLHITHCGAFHPVSYVKQHVQLWKCFKDEFWVHMMKARMQELYLCSESKLLNKWQQCINIHSAPLCYEEFMNQDCSMFLALSSSKIGSSVSPPCTLKQS